MGKIVKLIDLNSLYHFGVPGMRWGVRRVSRYSGSGKGGIAGTLGVAAGTAVRRKVFGKSSDHENKVDQLKSSIKAAKFKRFDKELAEFGRKEQAAYKKLDDIKGKKLSEINSSNSGKIKKLLAKWALDTDITNRKMAVVGKLEDEFITRDDKRNKTKSAQVEKAFQEYGRRIDKRVKEQASVPFPKDIFTALKADKEESERLVETLLQIELDNQ